jgi:cell division protein FtsI/penicillin-binding protein 2
MSLGDRPFCEYGKYYLGTLDIKLALTRSSNIFFCNAVVDFEKQRSFADYQSLVSLLGFGSQSGIELSGELKGLLPGPEYKLLNYQA